MNNTDYIKEKLNTLRIEYMASILSVIALGSGLAKMILSDYSFSFFSKLEAGNSLFDIGVVLFFILILNIIVVFYKLKKTINLLKDR